MNHENPRGWSHGAARSSTSNQGPCEGRLRTAVVLLGGGIAVSLALGCSPKRAVEHPRPSEGMAAADAATCLNKHVQSIWKGEDMAGKGGAGGCRGF